MLVGVAGAALFYVNNLKKTEKPKVAEEKVKVAYVGSIVDYDLLLDIATEKKFASENSLAIEKMPQVKDSTDILITKNSDYILNTTTNVLSYYLGAKDNQDNVQWIAAVTDNISNQFLVTKYSKDDLSKIKTAGVKRIGGAGQVYMAAVLGKIDSKIQPKYISTNDEPTKLQLLQKGNVDAVIISSTQSRDEAAKISGLYVYDCNDFLKDFKIPGGVMALSSTVKDRPELSERFVKTIYQSSQYIKNNKADTIKFIQSHYSLTESQAADSYNSLRGSLASSYVPNAENLQEISALVKSVFSLDSKKDLSGFIYTNFAEKAKK